MPLLNWEESYSVNVSEFNDQHKKLIDLINKLFDAMKAGKGKDVMGDIFSELIDYTVVHFQAEELLMHKYNYPDMNSHIAEHNDLTRQAKELEAKFKSGASFVTIDVLNFLKDWLTKHIVGSDKKYGPFFNSKGVN